MQYLATVCVYETQVVLLPGWRLFLEAQNLRWGEQKECVIMLRTFVFNFLMWRKGKGYFFVNLL